MQFSLPLIGGNLILANNINVMLLSSLPQVLWNGPYHLGATGLASIPLGRNWFHQNLLRSVPGFPHCWDKGHSLVHRTKSGTG